MLGRRLRAVEPRLDLERALHEPLVLDAEARELEEAVPLRRGVVPHVTRVAQPVGFLRALADEGVVADHDAMLRDARHLLHRRENVVEVVRGDAARDCVEARVGEGEVFRGCGGGGLHARREIDGDDCRPCLAQPTRDVAAAGRDVQNCDARARLAPLDDEVEVFSLRVDRARAVGVGALGPDVRHFASSTARRAPSSIVASGWMFGLPASARIFRPSSAFVPSRRTTIGYCDMSRRSSASRIPRATSSQRVMPPKMLKKIDLTCGSRVITSSASTTPCALPPPPRSQKFAGRPPTCATTSTVDMESPAPLPQMPTSPSSFT